MGIIETKLASEGDILNIGEGKYNLWKRNRKNKWGGGVILLVRKDLLEESVTYGVEEAEVLKISLRQNVGRYRNVVVTYVPPFSNSWSEDEYKKMLEDTRTCLAELLKENDDILLMEDFNCKEISWEN